MGSSKINRARANDQWADHSDRLRPIDSNRSAHSDRHHLVAITRDGDEPAYRSRAAPQLGVGLHSRGGAR